MATGGQLQLLHPPAPMRKDDLLFSLNVDSGRVRLEVHLNKGMAPP